MAGLVGLLDSLSSPYLDAIADTLVSGRHPHSIEEVVDALRNRGCWPQLAEFYASHMTPSNRQKVAAQLDRFDKDEKVQLAKAMTAKCPLDGGLLALALAESSEDDKAIAEIRGFVADNARTLGSLQVAISYGTDYQIVHAVDRILNPSAAAKAYITPIYTLLGAQIEDRPRLGRIIYESVNLLIKRDKDDNAIDLANSSGDKDAMMRVLLDESVHFIQSLNAGFLLKDKYGLKPWQCESIDRRIGDILCKAEVDYTWMEILGKHDLILRAAKDSENYQPLRDYVYERLGEGELENASRVTSALPNMKLDHARLNGIAAKLLDWKNRIENIGAEVYIAEVTGQPLNRDKLLAQILENLPYLSSYQRGKVSHVCAGFEYLKRQPAGLNDSEQRIYTYVLTLRQYNTETISKVG